jgi:transaldolase
MTAPIQTLIDAGTKIWLDSIDPEAVACNREWGITGATSNPVIVKELIETGQFSDRLRRLLDEGDSDEDVAWKLTDELVRDAQRAFEPVWRRTGGDDGYVSFELDPLLEDPEANLPPEERTRRYVELGRKWSAGHTNRMIKVPNTDAGVAALEELAASGVTMNVTLTFTPRQYVRAREAIWRGAQRRPSLNGFKSVYSIFVSRVDVYASKHVPGLSPRAQGQVGIVNAKRIWQMNQQFWSGMGLPLKQEIVFASMGVKLKGDPPWKYVEAFAGPGIETNPPGTNDEVRTSGKEFTRQVDRLPPDDVLAEIDRAVDMGHMEDTLMEEGIKKFADPQKELLELIARKRGSRQPAASR